MNKSLFLLIAITLIASQAYATNYKATNYVEPISRKLVKFPEIGIENEVDVGESIIYSANKIEKRKIEVFRDLTVNNKILWQTYKYDIVASEGDEVSKIAEGIFYKFQNSKDSVFSNRKISLFVPSSKTAEFELCSSSSENNIFLCEKIGRLNEGVDYNFISEYVFYPKSFKQELVYTGSSQGVVSMVYREFKDDIARPAFSQEIKFDITSDNVVGFRGSRFQIINANNTGIKYKVLQHLRRAE